MADKQENVQYRYNKDSDAVKFQLETDNLASELKKKMGLKPVQKTVDGKTFVEWEETERAWANKKGIENIVGLIRGYSDKINQLSNYDERQITSLMQEIHQAVARDIAENWNEYEIGTQGNANNIIELVTNITWSTFNGAKDGRTQEIVGESAEAKTVTKNESGDDDGLLPSF